MLKTIINRYKAKKEHNNRMTSPLWDLSFNHTVNTIKAINKQILLNELMEACGANPNDSIALVSIDRAIEDGRALGMITELYNKSELYYQIGDV